MRATFGDMRAFKQPYSLPPVGNFALEVEPPKAPHWDHCREQFAAKFNESVEGFYYSVHPNGAEDVACFLVKCEEVVGIKDLKKSYQHSTFCKTGKNTILWVSPSMFWLDCEMKRSLLTVFLRCGLNYNHEKDNFDDALFSENYKENKYARETRAAIMRFLFGFTKWTDRPKERTEYMSSKHGWHEEFRCQDNVGVRKKLALPDGEVMETSIIGVESLWA